LQLCCEAGVFLLNRLKEKFYPETDKSGESC